MKTVKHHNLTAADEYFEKKEESITGDRQVENRVFLVSHREAKTRFNLSHAYSDMKCGILV